jgi:hypothetical protein
MGGGRAGNRGDGEDGGSRGRDASGEASRGEPRDPARIADSHPVSWTFIYHLGRHARAFERRSTFQPLDLDPTDPTLSNDGALCTLWLNPLAARARWDTRLRGGPCRHGASLCRFPALGNPGSSLESLTTLALLSSLTNGTDDPTCFPHVELPERDDRYRRQCGVAPHPARASATRPQEPPERRRSVPLPEPASRPPPGELVCLRPMRQD